MKFLQSLIIAGALLFAAVYFGSNYAVASALEKWLGVSVSVGSVRWGISGGKMVISNVRIRNPAGYSSADMAKVSRIEADYDAAQLRRGIFKISKLRAVIDEVRLEKKSAAETNVMELRPVRRAIGAAAEGKPSRVPSLSFQIEKTALEMSKVVFTTKLGNDEVIETREVRAPAGDMNELNSPDRIAVYAVLLALQSAGWQTFIPSKEEVMQTVENQMDLFFELLRAKMQTAQAQIQQALAENRKSAA